MNRLRFSLPALSTDFWRAAQDHDLGGLASELAFKLILALFPFLIFLAAIGSYAARISLTADPAGTIVDSFGSTLPADTASMLRRQIAKIISGANPVLISVGAVGTIWPASGAARALAKSVNRANGIPDRRPWWKKIGLSLAITVVGGGALIAAVLALLLGELFATAIARSVGIGSAWAWTSTVLRLPLVVLFVVVAAQLLFWLAPDQRQPFRLWSPGSVAFGLAWSVFASVFSFYVAHLGHYESTYGSLAGVVVFLVWLYFSCWLLLAGAELNAVLEARRSATGARAPTPPEAERGHSRPAGTGGSRRSRRSPG